MTEFYPEMLLLGSTGSVGEQALDVAVRHHIPVVALAACRNVSRVEEQVRQTGARFCAMADPDAAKDLQDRLRDTSVRVFAGTEGICEMLRVVRDPSKRQVVQNAIIGRAGLEPTLTSLQNGYRLALANKESLVVAGKIVMETARANHAEIVPVDSEHSAIYQSLRAGNRDEILSIWLTASGGPFRGKKASDLAKITKAQALAHPTWKMGAKITVDSATLMNKGFEVIEAVHLFGVTPEQIRVLVHPESIIHSMVEYIDHSVIAQLSVPDMRQCVQYAMTDPLRKSAVVDRLDLTKLAGLTFFEPDMETFRLLPCAIDAIRKGGALPAVVNAANEVAVDAFLQEKIGFSELTDLVCRVKDDLTGAAGTDDLEGILGYDRLARERALTLLKDYPDRS